MLAAATDPAIIGIVAATRGDRYILRGLATFDLSPGQTASTSTIPIHSDCGTWLNRGPPCPNRGLQMKLIVTFNDIEHIKDALRASLPDVKSSHRVEALARGLGSTTNASMRAAWPRRRRRQVRTKTPFSIICASIRWKRRAAACCGRSRRPASGERLPRARAQRLRVPRDAGPRQDARRGEGALPGEPRGDVRGARLRRVHPCRRIPLEVRAAQVDESQAQQLRAEARCRARVGRLRRERQF